MTKYALITGAGTGIGYQLAIQLHKKGYQVIGISPDFDMHNMKPLESQIGLTSICCDITKVDQIKAALEKVDQLTGGKLDLLYNNAGVCPVGGPAMLTDDDLLKLLLDVNILGHMYMTKYFSQLVINAKGTIVFTSSVATRVPLSWTSGYCTTKAAIDHYALSIKGEMSAFDVKVYSVITGGVNTGIADNVKEPELKHYWGGEKVYQSLLAAAGMSRNSRSESAEDYAKEVVAKVTSSHYQGFNLYAGHGARLLHWARWYLPVCVMEYIVQTYFLQTAALKEVRQVRDAEIKAKKVE